MQAEPPPDPTEPPANGLPLPCGLRELPDEPEYHD
jgi:hypothetical protein